MKTLFITLVFLLFTKLVSAQQVDFSNDVVKFYSSEFEDVSASIHVQSNCEFLWNKTNKIDWIQKSGAVTYTLQIANLDSTSLGSEVGSRIVADVVFDSTIAGTLTLSRTQNGYEIHLNLTGGTSPINNRYTIATIEKL